MASKSPTARTTKNQSSAITIWVPGTPQPAGSKKAFPIKRANGKMGAVVSDDAKYSRSWKQQVAVFAATHIEISNDHQPMNGPTRLDCRFYMPRPKSHFGTGRNAHVLKPSAPRHHTQKPDATKLLRAVEDALSGLLWFDDVQIVWQNVSKHWTRGQPGVEIVAQAFYEQAESE